MFCFWLVIYFFANGCDFSPILTTLIRLNNRHHLNWFHYSDDDVIKWKHFPRNWPFVRGIHRSPVNSPHKGQWCGALMFSLICAWINGWMNTREAGNPRRHRTNFDVAVMLKAVGKSNRYPSNHDETKQTRCLHKNIKDIQRIPLFRDTRIIFY